MINEMSLNLQWWTWWSNPVQGIHATQQHRVAVQADKTIDYYDLLRLRSMVDAPDLPDALLLHRPQLKLLAFASDELLLKHLQRLAVLSMDRGMLHARPQEWEAQFGIRNPDSIRALVQHRQSVPTLLQAWQEGLCTQLSLQKHDGALAINMQDRVFLGLCAYLKSFAPKIYQRWVLTRSTAQEAMAVQLEKLPEDSEDVFWTWLQPDLEALWAEATAPFQEVELEAPQDDFDEDDPEYADLNEDEFFGGGRDA